MESHIVVQLSTHGAVRYVQSNDCNLVTTAGDPVRKLDHYPRSAGGRQPGRNESHAHGSTEGICNEPDPNEAAIVGRFVNSEL